MEGRCSNCNHFFQPYKCKYRTALQSNWYPQSISFLRCNFDRFSPGWRFAPPLLFPGILKPAAYQGKDSTDVYILKLNANYFSIKGLYHRRLCSKSRDLTLNGISKILWTATITKMFFSIIQHTCNKFFFHVSNSFKQSFIKDYQNSNLLVFTSD